MQPLTCSSHTVIYSEPSLLVFTGKQLVQFLPRATAEIETPVSAVSIRRIPRYIPQFYLNINWKNLFQNLVQLLEFLEYTNYGLVMIICTSY